MVLVLILPERPTLSYELPPSNFSRSPNSNLSKNPIFAFLSYNFFTPISKNPIMITMLLDFLHLPNYRSLVKICEKLLIFTFIRFFLLMINSERAICPRVPPAATPNWDFRHQDSKLRRNVL